MDPPHRPAEPGPRPGTRRRPWSGPVPRCGGPGRPAPAPPRPREPPPAGTAPSPGRTRRTAGRSRRPPPGPGPSAGRSRARSWAPRRPGPGTATRRRPHPAAPRPPGGAGRGPVRRGWAWRCPRPCPGTPAWSPPRAPRPPGARPRPGRPRSCRMPWAPPGPATDAEGARAPGSARRDQRPAAPVPRRHRAAQEVVRVGPFDHHVQERSRRLGPLEVHDLVRPGAPLDAALAPGPLHQDLDGAPLVRAVALQRDAFLHRQQPVEPLLDDLPRDLVLERGGRGSGAGRVLERVRAVEPGLLHHPERPPEVLLGLAGEPHDDVGGERDPRNGLPDPPDPGQVPLRAV